MVEPLSKEQNDKFNDIEALTILGEMSLTVSHTGVDCLFLDLSTNNRDGTAVLDAADVRKLRDWLNKVLP